MTNHTKSNQRRSSTWTLPILALLLLQLMGGMLLSPHRTFFPVYVQQLGYSPLQVSTISTARLVLAMVASLLGGTLSDTVGRKWTTFLGNLGFLAGSLLFLTPNLGWIGLLWALSGLGMGLRTLGSQAYLMDVAAPHALGLLTAFYNWGYTLGGALSGPLVGVLLDARGYPAFGWALILFCLPMLTVNVVMPHSRRDTQERSTVGAGFLAYAGLARRRSVILLVLIRSLPTVYWGMALVLIPLLLDGAGATKTQIALYATVSQGVASLAQLVTGRAADRFGLRTPAVTVFAVLFVSACGTGLWADNLWGVFVTGSLGAAAAWSLSTLLPSLVAQATETEERGRVLGWIHLWWNVAMILGSMLGGALLEIWTGLPFYLAGALNVVAIGVVWVYLAQSDHTQKCDVSQTHAPTRGAGASHF